ncbi:hypothetical protein ACJMK2_011990 [Sinanodonta woodiana]|uniref:Amidase domain-containing protein n=1 Tax=Sinanodonta woodiana TaxID=1069815 RepID=A0ABD3V6S4_SINWO
MSDLYKVPAIKPPSVDQLQELSRSLGVQCSVEELEDYREHMKGLTESYDRVSRLERPSLPVKYPRTPGYRPSPQDNKHNAWYWRCDIKGAESGKLSGKTIAIKDNVAVAGVPMMNGSKILEGYVPEIDATIISRILDAGGRIIGKTNCEDLCFCGSSFTNITGPILNPFDPTRTSGGSSAGSAVAVATGDADMAIGGDQGGSIRIPSCWCGLAGLKPTFGLVPYTGASSIETTIDHLGPIAKSVEDCALLLEVIAGFDEGRDPRQYPSIQVPEYSKLLTNGIAGKKIGIVNEGFEGCESDVVRNVQEAALSLRRLGAEVEEMSLPMHNEGVHIWTLITLEGADKCMIQGNGTGYLNKGYYPFSLQEAYARGIKARPQDLSETTKMMILYSRYVSQNYQNRFYAMGQNQNVMLTKAYNKALETYDVLVMPTLPFKASKLPTSKETRQDRLNLALKMIKNTAPFDITGHPALTVNVGISEGLPIGMMIIGRHFDDATVLQVGHAFEKAKI